MNQQRPVETVEEFKLRIAAILRAKPEQISAPPRPHRLKRATNRKPKRQDPVSALQTGSNFSPRHLGHGAATSAVAGRLKCFMCPQTTHFHASYRLRTLRAYNLVLMRRYQNTASSGWSIV